MDGDLIKVFVDFVTTIVAIAVVSVLAWVVYGIYLLFGNSDNDEKFVSKKKIVPEMRFVTDGKVIDTVYVYKVSE